MVRVRSSVRERTVNCRCVYNVNLVMSIRSKVVQCHSYRRVTMTTYGWRMSPSHAIPCEMTTVWDMNECFLHKYLWRGICVTPSGHCSLSFHRILLSEVASRPPWQRVSARSNVRTSSTLRCVLIWKHEVSVNFITVPGVSRRQITNQTLLCINYKSILHKQTHKRHWKPYPRNRRRREYN